MKQYHWVKILNRLAWCMRKKPNTTHAKFHAIKFNASIICSTLNVETSSSKLLKRYNQQTPPTTEYIYIKIKKGCV